MSFLVQWCKVKEKYGLKNKTGSKICCGQVMFSQRCVKNFVHGVGEACLPHCMLGYTHTHPRADNPPRQTPPTQTPHTQTPLWADTPLGRSPWADTSPGRHHPTPKTATAADSIHPTGMHSCCFMFCRMLPFCPKFFIVNEAIFMPSRFIQLNNFNGPL